MGIFYDATLGREVRIIELKQDLDKLFDNVEKYYPPGMGTKGKGSYAWEQ